MVRSCANCTASHLEDPSYGSSLLQRVARTPSFPLAHTNSGLYDPEQDAVPSTATSSLGTGCGVGGGGGGGVTGHTACPGSKSLHRDTMEMLGAWSLASTPMRPVADAGSRVTASRKSLTYTSNISRRYSSRTLTLPLRSCKLRSHERSTLVLVGVLMPVSMPTVQPPDAVMDTYTASPPSTSIANEGSVTAPRASGARWAGSVTVAVSMMPSDTLTHPLKYDGCVLFVTAGDNAVPLTASSPQRYKHRHATRSIGIDATRSTGGQKHGRYCLREILIPLSNRAYPHHCMKMATGTKNRKLYTSSNQPYQHR
eukprot:m.373730 g.373730  ORF g.373730 m.373730 type:complete len:312 (+) comp20889_c0_seq3:348-1283(+)